MQSVEPVDVNRATSVPGSRTLVVITPAISTALLAAGVLGAVPQLYAVIAAAALSMGVHVALLVWLSLKVHHRHQSFGPCRGIGFVCLALFFILVSVLSLVAVTDRPLDGAALATGGVVVATTLYLAGLLMLPAAAPSFLAKVRQSLDGIGVAACCLFTAWILLVAPRHIAGGLTLLCSLAVAVLLATATITALRAARYRVSAFACAGGAALAVIGLAGLALVLAGAVGAEWLPLAGAAMVYAPVLSWLAARRYGAAPADLGPLDVTGTFAGYPVLAVPIGLVLLAALYHLFAYRSFDLISAGLGCGVVAALAVREAFGVVDVRRYTRQIAVQEAHFRSIVSGSSDVTMMLDAGLVVRWQSPAAARQFGLSDLDVVGRPFVALMHPDDAQTVREQLTEILSAAPSAQARTALIDARLRDGFGHWRDTESTVSDQRTVPEVGTLVVHVRDVGERRELERTLHRMAFTDQLTALANRRQLLRSLGAMRGLPGQPGALLVIDLDGFTAVNDVRGHEVGDAVLVEVARRLRDGVDESDLPARLSGDEFGVLTADQPVQAYALASRLLTILTQPYQLPGATVHLRAAIGIAELSGADSVGDVISRAALALRRARQLRQSRIEWYDEMLEADLLRRLNLEQELPGAIERGELDMVYLPVMDLVEGHPIGAEALLRWRHPRLGPVPPTDFLAVAEDLGLIDEIGDWVLHRCCRQLSSWLRDGRDLWLAINLSRRQLAAKSLVNTVRIALDSHQVPADRLVLEVTEQGLGSDNQLAVAQLAGLRALGVRTALAQFGTGSTPLSYLRRLPIDMLKVDRVLFAEPATRTGPAAPIIDVVVGLGRRLGLELIAEGLEAESHVDVVRTAGCRYGQGHVFGVPSPAERFEAFLESRRSAL